MVQDPASTAACICSAHLPTAMCPRLLQHQLLPSRRALHRWAQLLAQLAQRSAACHSRGSHVQHCSHPPRLLRQQGQGGVLQQLCSRCPAVQVGQQQQLVRAPQVAHEAQHLLLPLLLAVLPAAGLLLLLLAGRHRRRQLLAG